MPRQISAARHAKKAERAFFKQHEKAAKLAKRRQERELKLGQSAEKRHSEQAR
jgi:hypothetical protein